MQWKEIATNSLILKNYELFKKSGVLDYIDETHSNNKELEDLLIEANEIFRQETVDELINLIIHFLAEKFIPSNMVFILNEGIMFNRIKTIVCRNMKISDDIIVIESLEPFEQFFRTYRGTTSFLILENEMEDTGLLAPFVPYKPRIVVPVLGISGLYGMIFFGEKVLGEDYDTREISYIDKLMNFTSIGIQNTIHYEHSVRDSKTGLYNHNFFIHRVNEQIARAKRVQKPFSVILMDIDNFKLFNDSYGHLAGDEVIIQLSKVLKRALREGDILSRFGGEEFTILLPYADKNEGWNAAERFRKTVEEMETKYQENILKITISLGIATYNYHEKINDITLLKRADDALYKSKKTGRNKTTSFKSGLLTKAQDMDYNESNQPSLK